MRYRFNDHELDTAARRLIGPTGEVHVEPQVFDVLAHLVVHRDRVVTKEGLLDEVWGSRFVSESALTSRIKAGRSAVGDSGRAQAVIRTVHGTGYQFVAEVAEVEAPTEGTETGSAVRRVPRAGNVLRGRERELHEVVAKIEVESLVTLIGPGGTGKTRLAIELAAALPADRSVVFVDLAAVRDDHALGQALAAALEVDTGMAADALDACSIYLRANPMLLIVDNCEHVVQAAYEMIARILETAPSTKIVATSRIPIGHAHEALYRLSPLPVLVMTDDISAETAAQNAAIALFCDRAVRAQSDFTLTEDSVADVAGLCSALDGLPLALELAAGRLGTFSVGDLLTRLDRRLDLLGDQRDSSEHRHRTLRATLNWSYELLAPPCRRLFRFLSVFPAGLTLDGIEWLGARIDLEGDPIDALDGLVEASLVGRVEPRSGTRYVLLETMRAFGIDQLEAQAEKDQALDRCAEWVLEITGEMMRTLFSAREVHWDDRIRRELPNVREARLRLRSGDRIADLLTISINLNEWARLRDVSEIWAWCDDLQTLEGLSVGDEARVAALAALAAWRRGRIEEAQQLGEEAAAGAEDDWTTAQALSSQGVAALFMGRFEDAAELWSARSRIDGYNVDGANAVLASAYAGDVAAARIEIDRLRPEIVSSDSPGAIAWVEYVTGEIAELNGDPDSREWLEAAVAHAHEVGDAFIIGVAGLTLGTAVAASGDTAEAAAQYRDLIDHWLRSGTWTQQWTTLRHAARLLGDHDPALALTIMRNAAVDEAAPEMDPVAEAEVAALIAEWGRAAGDSAGEATPMVVERSELAQRTRGALALLVDG